MQDVDKEPAEPPETEPVDPAVEGKTLDLFLTEARKSYDLSIETINSYDRKLSQVFTMNTALFGILLLGVSLIFTNLEKGQLLNMDNPVVTNWLGSLVVSLVCIFISLLICLFGLFSQKLNVNDPKDLFNKYDTMDENELKEFLIVQISELFKMNLNIAGSIRNIYAASIVFLSIGIIMNALTFYFMFQILSKIFTTTL